MAKRTRSTDPSRNPNPAQPWTGPQNLRVMKGYFLMLYLKTSGQLVDGRSKAGKLPGALTQANIGRDIMAAVNSMGPNHGDRVDPRFQNISAALETLGRHDLVIPGFKGSLTNTPADSKNAETDPYFWKALDAYIADYDFETSKRNASI